MPDAVHTTAIEGPQALDGPLSAHKLHLESGLRVQMIRHTGGTVVCLPRSAMTGRCSTPDTCATALQRRGRPHRHLCLHGPPAQCCASLPGPEAAAGPGLHAPWLGPAISHESAGPDAAIHHNCNKQKMDNPAAMRVSACPLCPASNSCCRCMMPCCPASSTATTDMAASADAQARLHLLQQLLRFFRGHALQQVVTLVIG